MYLNLSLALAHALAVGLRSTYLENIGLEVSAHCHSSYANHQRGKRIKATAITGRLRDSTAVSPRGFQGRGGYRREPTSQTTRFKTHPNQTCEPKHDSNTYVLDLLGGVRTTGVRAKGLHSGVGYAIQENHERLDKFCGDMAAKQRVRGSMPNPIPRMILETRKSDETVAPENATLCTIRTGSVRYASEIRMMSTQWHLNNSHLSEAHKNQKALCQ